MCKKLSLIFIAIIFFTFFYKYLTHIPQLEFVYDNSINGGGDKVAQERLVECLFKKDIKISMISEHLNDVHIKWIKNFLFPTKKFAIFQTTTQANRKNILEHRLNNNIIFFNLVYLSDISKQDIIPAEKICKKAYDKSFFYKDGRKIEGMLITTQDDVSIDCDPSKYDFKFIKSWYPTLERSNYNHDDPKYNKIHYTYGGAWDKKRSSDQIILALKSLGKNYIIDIYGKDIIETYGVYARDVFGSSYKGFIPTARKYLDVMHDYKAILVLHSENHIKHKIPSGRIFEAMASARVIISDENEWVKKILGDNALYIDTLNKQHNEIQAQIENHMKWINSNPEKVKMMTKNVKNIFNEKYALETQVEFLLAKLQNIF